MHIKVCCSSCGSWFRADERLVGKRVKCPKCGNIFHAEDASRATYDAFISYANEDGATANLVCSELEKEGLRCWIAPRDILPGREYAAAIVEAIDRSRSLVLVFSRHADHSSQVRREVERAASKDVPIVPLRIENVTLCKAMEFFISSHHWMDALTRPLEPHIRQLATKLRQMLSIPADRKTVPPPQPPRSKQEPITTSSPSSVEDVAKPEPGAMTPSYEQGDRLAFTMGHDGLLLIFLRTPAFASASGREEGEGELWSRFEYACRQLGIRSGLREHLTKVTRLTDDEVNGIAGQHIVNPLGPLTGDKRYDAFALLGMYWCALNLFLQCEMQGQKQARPSCTDGFAKLLLSACKAQLPLDTINRLRSMQRRHASSEDTVDLHALRLELVEVVQRPLYVTPPMSEGGSAN